ncbi:MAG: DUF3795 domain-containing protein [Candidatus Thorarchaeota archaeon]
MKFQFDSYCGLYCGACFIMNAYRQNRNDCLPEEWVSPLDNKEIKCHGCKSEIIFENCRGCEIRKCAQSKDLEFCNECSQFPCEKIKTFEKMNLKHHEVALFYFDRIKEAGIQEWLKEQKERWSCSYCGNPFSWYEEICTYCGAKLFSCIEESKALEKNL